MIGFEKLSFTLPYWVCKTFAGTDWFVKASSFEGDLSGDLSSLPETVCGQDRANAEAEVFVFCQMVYF